MLVPDTLGIVWGVKAKPLVVSMAGGFAVCRAAPCVHPAVTRRIAANIAKLPELLRKP